MKQLFTKFSLPFCFYIAIYFLTNFQGLQASKYQSRPYLETYQQPAQHVSTSLHSIKNLQSKIFKQTKFYQKHIDKNNSHENSTEIENCDDCITEIMIVLTNTYEKIINETVTYYIMMNTPMQQNLHTKIAIILAEDVVKIITILCKRLLEFSVDSNLTWKQKVWYCIWITSMITVIKLGIDQIVDSMPVILPESLTNQEDQSAYLKEKFNNYK